MLDVTSCFSFTFALHEHCIPLFVCSFSVLFYLICIGTDFRNVMVSNNWWFAKTIFPSAGTENELTYNARTCTKFPAKKKRGNETIFTVNEMPWSGIDTGPLYLSLSLALCVCPFHYWHHQVAVPHHFICFRWHLFSFHSLYLLLLLLLYRIY